MQHFLSLLDWSSEALLVMVEKAIFLKQEHRSGGNPPLLQGKTLALLFERASLRTRLSFEMAMQHLGGNAIYIRADEVGLETRESIADTARVLGDYVHAVVLRLNRYESLQKMAMWSPIPVINGLTKYNHPCQAMSDVLTLMEEFGQVKGLTVAYLGRSNQDVARSLLFAAAKFGFRLVICSPPEFSLDEESLEIASTIARENGEVSVDNVVQRIPDPQEAVRCADAIYTDVWISLGSTGEVEAGNRSLILAPYQVNDALLAHAPLHAIVMHCMPANRGQEITDSVADGKRSRLFPQAANRLHLQKSILLHLLGSP